MLKIIKTNKGVYLINMAILLPVFLSFWGWIISRALLLDHEIDQQIAVDMAAISGADHGSELLIYEVKKKDLLASMVVRSEMILETFGKTADTTPTAELISQDQGNGGGVGHEGHGHEDDSLEVNIVSTSPVFDLLFISNATVTKQASAEVVGFNPDCFKTKVVCPAFTGITRLLP